MEASARRMRHPRRRHRFMREERELEFARIVAFSDGVFAIAITLLVLSLHVPEGVSDLPQKLGNQLPDFSAFVLSFAVLARIWLFHHRLFSALHTFDRTLIALNFLYLALVTLVPFTSEVIGDYGHVRSAALLYATNMAALGLVGGVTVVYAFRSELLKLDVAETVGIDTGPGNWLVAAVFIASMPLILISANVAEVSWLIFFVAGGVASRYLHGRGGETAGSG
jgi:uncharacterized membrane protein